MSDGEAVALIEAKALGKPLEDKATDQVHIYANQNGIPYMIVTDGNRWEMYEVFKQATLDERRLMKFELRKQPAHEIVLQALRIWKPNLASGKPKAAMKPVLGPPPDKDVDKDTPALPVPAPPDKIPVNQLYLEYWTTLKNNLELHKSRFKIGTPPSQCFITFAVGVQGFRSIIGRAGIKIYLCRAHGTGTSWEISFQPLERIHDRDKKRDWCKIGLARKSQRE